MERKRKDIPTPFERTIMEVLEGARHPLTIKQISEKGNMDWKTVKKYVDHLKDAKEIKCEFKGNKIMCRPIIGKREN